MIDVFTVRGTGEPLAGAHNLLTQVTRRLDPNRFTSRDIEYPASIGPVNETAAITGLSEADSITIGVARLVTAIRSTPNIAGILGYSLGAMVVTRFLERRENGEFADCEVAFAGLLANPLRNPGDSWDRRGAPGHGLAGTHTPYPPEIQVFEIAHPDDGITCCPVDSPLRTVSDVVSAFTFATGGGWSQDLVDRLQKRRWQLAAADWWRDPRRYVARYQEAARLVDGYVRTGQHCAAYVDLGYVNRLATRINQVWGLPA